MCVVEGCFQGTRLFGPRWKGWKVKYGLVLSSNGASASAYVYVCPLNRVAAADAAAGFQALALDEDVPSKEELEDDTEPDVLGISRHQTTLVRAVE